MKLTFDDIVNKEKNKPAFVCGLGASINAYKEILTNRDKDNTVLLSCNEWDVKASWLDIDYWVFASTINTVSQRYERVNSKNCILVYEEGLDYTPREKVAELLKVDYVPYDQRHYENTVCRGGPRPDGRNWCCDFFIKDRLTIMHYLQKITKSEEFYTECHTVATNMVAIAIILGCNPIYIFGVELDYELPYVDGSFNLEMEQSQGLNNFKKRIPSILRSFEIIKRSADNIGVKIYSCVPKSSINDIFPKK